MAVAVGISLALRKSGLRTNKRAPIITDTNTSNSDFISLQSIEDRVETESIGSGILRDLCRFNNLDSISRRIWLCITLSCSVPLVVFVISNSVDTSTLVLNSTYIISFIWSSQVFYLLIAIQCIVTDAPIKGCSLLPGWISARDTSRVKIIGRRCLFGEEGYIFDAPGVYIEICFSGSRLNIQLQGARNTFSIYLKQVDIDEIQSKNLSFWGAGCQYLGILTTSFWEYNYTQYTIVSDLPVRSGKAYIVRLVKRTEYCRGMYGPVVFTGCCALGGQGVLNIFDVENNKTVENETKNKKKKRRRIHFIGGSSMLGIGATGPVNGSYLSYFDVSSSSCDASWATTIARRTNAEYVMTALSGVGVTVNTNKDWSALLNELIHTTLLSKVNNDMTSLPDMTTVPDIIVFQIGDVDWQILDHNDDCHIQHFITKYQEIIANMRKTKGTDLPFLHVFDPMSNEGFIVGQLLPMCIENDSNSHIYEIQLAKGIPNTFTGCLGNRNRIEHSHVADAIEKEIWKHTEWTIRK